MEILEPNSEVVPALDIEWEEWLKFDTRPRIVKRGHDFAEPVERVRTALYTQASQRGMDVTLRLLDNERILFQVFHPDGYVPRLPDVETYDARKKYPWDKWLNGETHQLQGGIDFHADPITLRQYAYRQAADRGLKVGISLGSDNVVVLRAYAPGAERPTLRTQET